MNQKISALIRTESDRSLASLAMLVAAHMHLFGCAASIATQEELLASGGERTTRILRLELTTMTSGAEGSAQDFELIEKSLAHAAKRAGVAATFELFIARDAAPEPS